MPASSANGERGASTMYVLKDEAFTQVLIKDWPEYDSKERQIVSEHMEGALERLGLAKDTEEWKRLYPDGRPSLDPVRKAALLEKLDDGGDLSTEDEGGSHRRQTERNSLRRPSNSSSSMESPTKLDVSDERTGAKPTIKKNSTMDRLKKAAKGKGSSRSSTPASVGTSTMPKKPKERDGLEVEKKSKTALVEESNSKPIAASQHTSTRLAESVAAAKDVKTNKVTTSKSIAAKKKATAPARAAARKDIAYTDSSEDEKMEVDEEDRPSRSTSGHLVSRARSTVSEQQKSTSTSPEEKQRVRHGVGGGAAFTSEPWLDVKSRNDWERLAERFKRVFEEYTDGMARLREEEDLIRLDLQQAREEKTVATSRNNAMLHIDLGSDEKEEGEASPTLEEEPNFGIVTASVDPPPSVKLAWRNRTMERREKGLPNPMSYEEIKTRARSLQETESQLIRMKGTLQVSKRKLERIAA